MKWTPPQFKAEPVRDPRQRIWNVMIVQKRFTVRDLKYLAQVGHSLARLYLHALRRVGYVRLASPQQRGQFGGYALWRLINNTGPLAPVVCAHETGVYDPNLKQHYPYPADEPADEPVDKPPETAGSAPPAPAEEEIADARKLA